LTVTVYAPLTIALPVDIVERIAKLPGIGSRGGAKEYAYFTIFNRLLADEADLSANETRDKEMERFLRIIYPEDFAAMSPSEVEEVKRRIITGDYLCTADYHPARRYR
jgi:hypothetical protein